MEGVLVRHSSQYIALVTSNEVAWNRVLREVRPLLALAVLMEDWDELSQIWAAKRYLVERAVQ
jgi:hypothetical protein